MPNYVENKLTVISKKKGAKPMEIELPELRELLANFSFKKVMPMPEAIRVSSNGATITINLSSDAGNRQTWCSGHWGTKWDLFHFDNEKIEKSLDLLEKGGHFITANAPPIPVIRKLQVDFPGYDFWLQFGGEIDREGIMHPDGIIRAFACAS